MTFFSVRSTRRRPPCAFLCSLEPAGRRRCPCQNKEARLSPASSRVAGRTLPLAFGPDSGSLLGDTEQEGRNLRGGGPSFFQAGSLFPSSPQLASTNGKLGTIYCTVQEFTVLWSRSLSLLLRLSHAKFGNVLSLRPPPPARF